MLYENSPEKAAEYLRLALSLMGKHKLISSPINFTLCYEYVSGTKQQLIDDFDHLVNNDEIDKNSACVALFKKHIWDDDKRNTNKLRIDLSKIISETFSNIGLVQSETSDSVDKLVIHSKELSDFTSVEDMQHILAKVVKETERVSQNGNNLKILLDNTNSEIEQLRQELEKTKHEATTDPLTGLRNRRAFEKMMLDNMELVDKNDSHLCLVMVDIDYFKKINDKYGHVFGDKVLKSVASLLTANIKGKDAISRFGGEEFAIMLPDTRLEFAEIVAENLRRAIESARIKKKNTGDILEKITVSLGITRYQSGETTEEFIDRADRALYQSKDNGRNRVTIQV